MRLQLLGIGNWVTLTSKNGFLWFCGHFLSARNAHSSKNISVHTRSVVSKSLDPMNPPGSSVHGISQAKILAWVLISFSGIFSTQELNLHLLHSQVNSFTTESPREVQYKHLLFSKYVIDYVHKAVSFQCCFCSYSNCVFCFYSLLFFVNSFKFFKVICLFLQDFDNVYSLSICLVL